MSFLKLIMETAVVVTSMVGAAASAAIAVVLVLTEEVGAAIDAVMGEW